MPNDIWILVQHRKGSIEEATLGLIGEGRRLKSQMAEEGIVTALALCSDLGPQLEDLGTYGADRVLYVNKLSQRRFHGELFAKVVYALAKRYGPAYILMAHTPETADLAPRLSALLETGLVTRAMDLRIDESGETLAMRPIANGHLFEEIYMGCPGPHVVSFLPSVLSTPEPDMKREIEIITEPLEDSVDGLKTNVVEVIEAPPEELDLEEADIIVSGGRGVGKGESFNIIHELAGAIGASVGGTRPIIDWQTLPFDRQIGQTGKTVIPRLIFSCGISGANEFTAGMERSRLVIAINTDPHARIFRFADLGVVGDLHEILPILIERLKEVKKSD